jgi:hypothetical protein
VLYESAAFSVASGQPRRHGILGIVTTSRDARSAARWDGDVDLALDHVALREDDFDWLAPVESLTLWAVKVPPTLLCELPNLTALDIRGGSRTELEMLDGCRHLRRLHINQIRGLADISVVTRMNTLEGLDLYGLPQVKRLPSLASLTRLRRLDLGSMKGLTSIGPGLDAPNLRALLLSRTIAVTADDVRRIQHHTALTQFDWFTEDVPDKTWQPVTEQITKQPVRPLWLHEWLATDSRV